MASELVNSKIVPFNQLLFMNISCAECTCNPHKQVLLYYDCIGYRDLELIASGRSPTVIKPLLSDIMA